MARPAVAELEDAKGTGVARCSKWTARGKRIGCTASRAQTRLTQRRVCCAMRAEIFTVRRRTAARSGTAVAAFKREGAGHCTRWIKLEKPRCSTSSEDF